MGGFSIALQNLWKIRSQNRPGEALGPEFDGEFDGQLQDRQEFDVFRLEFSSSARGV